jgi:G3E family GTPase
MRPRAARLPVTVLCGFLGAGKTTLLRRLLREQSALRCAIIVNDLSDLAVDAELIEEAREEHDDIVIDLHGGALGGALRPQLLEALDRLGEDRSVDYLLIETSGSTHPASLLHDLRHHPALVLDTVVTVVDGLNLLRDHAGGQGLLAPPGGIAANAPLALLRAQVEAASVLLVAKADLLNRPQAQAMLDVLRRLNPTAEIVTMAFGRVDPGLLMNARVRRRRGVPGRAAARRDPAPAPWSDEPGRYGIGSVTLHDPRPLHPARLHALFTEQLPVGVHRSKGWVWLASRPLDVFVWHQAGSQLGLEWVATWKAGILDDPDARLDPHEREALAQKVFAVHPVFGDRHCELTIIGQYAERMRFAELLRECFCHDAEVAAWQRGATFDDPWPRTLRRV